MLEGGRIDALVRTQGVVLRTARPAATELGLAQVRRAAVWRGLAVLHVIFAPVLPRPLLLSCVRLHNRTGEALALDYTELWEIRGEQVSMAEGACSCLTPRGERALADVSAGIRARAPEPLPGTGLALELRMVLPPDATRELSFAYAAPEPGESAAALVRAWRGDAARELERTVRDWMRELAGEADPLAEYRLRMQ